MSSAAGSLTEPEVLARTKRRLFPDEESYVVADTQFSAASWLADSELPEQVRAALAPFNHVRVGSGYPDLVGVGVVDDELLAVDRLDDEPPLVVVEAKGHTASGRVDTSRGIVQAYDRLGEANAAYLAAPIGAITGQDRTLARELNVGVLGVDDGRVRALERPRLVGNRTTTETSAIRYQAGAQGVADQSFGLNHPKNYLGYALAWFHAGETETIVADRVVGAVDDARRGARFLGLVGGTPERLTSLGREVVRFAVEEHGSIDRALDSFAEWAGSRKRFAELAPRWGQLTRRVVYAYPATQLLVEEIQHMHEDLHQAPTLVELVQYFHERHPAFTVELFVRGTE
ncbi:MAG: hypothetical protein V5A49_06435, partial [Haloarcula sp.]